VSHFGAVYAVAESDGSYKPDATKGFTLVYRPHGVVEYSVPDYTMFAEAYVKNLLSKSEKKDFAKTNPLFKALVSKVIQLLPWVLSPRSMAIHAHAFTRTLRASHIHTIMQV
jgi:hypothetical protein